MADIFDKKFFRLPGWKRASFFDKLLGSKELEPLETPPGKGVVERLKDRYT
jgi:hypothetical protein